MRLFKKLSVSFRRLNSPDVPRDGKCEGREGAATCEPKVAQRHYRCRSGQKAELEGGGEEAHPGAGEEEQPGVGEEEQPGVGEEERPGVDGEAQPGVGPGLSRERRRGDGHHHPADRASTGRGQNELVLSQEAGAGLRTSPTAQSFSGHRPNDPLQTYPSCEESGRGGAERYINSPGNRCAVLPDRVTPPQAPPPLAETGSDPGTGRSCRLGEVSGHLSSNTRPDRTGMWSISEGSLEANVSRQRKEQFVGQQEAEPHSTKVYSIFQFSFLPDVCLRLCFSFLTVEEVIRYQVLCKDVQRAIGFDHVLRPADPWEETVRRKQAEGHYLRTVSAEPPHLARGDVDETAKSSSLWSLDSGSCGVGVRELTEGGEQLKASCFSSSVPGRGLDESSTFVPRPMACLLGSYPVLTVGMSWMAAPSSVRLAYLTHFRSLRELKIFFCSRPEWQQDVRPTTWPDVWLLLTNNQKTLQRLSLVTLPYDATVLARLKQDPQKKQVEECGDTLARAQRGTQGMLELVADPWDGRNEVVLRTSARDQIPANDVYSSREAREGRQPGSSRPRGGCGNVGSSASPVSEVYLEALRELSILGSATSSLAALTAVQACLPPTVDVFSLHGNLPRSLPLPVSSSCQANDLRTISVAAAASATSGGRGGSRMLGFNEAFRNLFGWTGEEVSRRGAAENQVADPVQASEEDEDPLPADANRAALVRSVMTMHGLSVLDIRMPPMLDLSSFRVIPSLVLMSTRLRHVTLDLRQLVELVDLGALTAATADGPFGGYGLPFWRPLQQLDTEEGGDERRAPEWTRWGTQRLLPNLREVVLREPLHIGWAVEDVVRFMSILLSLPRCTVSAAAVILHQHSLLGPIRPDVDWQIEPAGDAGEQPTRMTIPTPGTGEPADSGVDRLVGTRQETLADEDLLTSGEEAARSSAAAMEFFQLGDVTSGDDVDRGTPTPEEPQQDAAADFLSSQETRTPLGPQPRQLAEAAGGIPDDAVEGEDPGVHIFGPNQYVMLLRQVVEHLAPNICSLRIRYTSATTCDLPVANVSFPLLQELVLDNYLPSAHLEIDKIVVPRTHCITLGLNGHQLHPFRQRPEWMDGGAVTRSGQNFCSSQGSYLPLLRALEPVSYYFQGTEDVIFLWGINEELTAEVPDCPSGGVVTALVKQCVPVFTKPVVGCPGLLCLSLTVCGRELHDSVKEVLWEAERRRNEDTGLQIAATDALSGSQDDDVDCNVSDGTEETVLDEAVHFDGEADDPFASFDFPTLFAAQTPSSPGAEVSGENTGGPQAWVEQRSQPVASSGLDRSGTRIWSVPSAVFGGCMGCEDIDNNDSLGPGCPTRHDVSEARSGAASQRQGTSNDGRARPGAAVSHTATAPSHANIFSQVASRVAEFFGEHVVGTCANALFSVPQDADRGGLLMALSLLAQAFGERSVSRLPASSARPGIFQDVDELDSAHVPGRAVLGCTSARRFAVPVSRKCVHFVGLNIVDFELHSTCAGCSSAAVAAALTVIDSRFDGVVAYRPRRATRTFGARDIQSNGGAPNGSQPRDAAPPEMSSQRGVIHVPQGKAAFFSSLSGNNAFQDDVEGVLGLCSESSANWECVGRTGRRERRAGDQHVVSTSRGGQHCVPATTAAAGVTMLSGRAKFCITDAQVDTDSGQGRCTRDSESGAGALVDLPPAFRGKPYRTRQRAELSRCETNFSGKQVSFCCPVVGRHLELFLAVFPSLQFLEFRYSGQHPMYLLDQQALRSALGSTAIFLKHQCDFEETGDIHQPGVGGAFSRCFHTITKLGLGCQRSGEGLAIACTAGTSPS
ncbi:hypothetical protein CSUI_000652 [Cystoisospora suis]|uniref:Uncharacterized protein n=1 Tax=Cystoisospora suis TaxID=483139 RepID=A0A2C6KNB2_9APIC|nr:hypothetical protein CSUI_000652 [Cystoisospora suis]